MADNKGDVRKTWEANRRQIAHNASEYRTELSEISRLFRRVIVNGTESERAEIKVILAETKQKLIELLKRIDQI